jgi:hypothetical protein
MTHCFCKQLAAGSSTTELGASENHHVLGQNISQQYHCSPITAVSSAVLAATAYMPNTIAPYTTVMCTQPQVMLAAEPIAAILLKQPQQFLPLYMGYLRAPVSTYEGVLVLQLGKETYQQQQNQPRNSPTNACRATQPHKAEF